MAAGSSVVVVTYVLLAGTNRLMKPAYEKNSGGRRVQRRRKSVAFVEFFHEKPQD
jgi:hypothetical protein